MSDVIARLEAKLHDPFARISVKLGFEAVDALRRQETEIARQRRLVEAAVDAYNAGRYMTDVNLANAVRAYLGGAMPAFCDEPKP